jgi:outer membrane protein assembly factor BamB
MFRITGLLILLFSLFHVVNAQQQWPMVGGSAEGNSWTSAEDSLYPPFEIVESFLPYPMPGRIFDFTIYEDLLVAGIEKSSENMFYGIDMVTKDTLWVFPVPGSKAAVNFVPAQNSEYVIVSAQLSNILYCLHRETGIVKWDRDFYYSLMGCSPLIDDNKVFIKTDSLFCLDISDGHIIWSYSGTFGQTAPCVDDNACYLTANQKTIAVNKNTGELIWAKYNSYKGEVAIDDFFLYTLSNDSVIARNKANGSVEWAYRIPDAVFSNYLTKSLAVDDSVVAIAIEETNAGVAQVLALNKRNGSYLWDHTFTNSGIVSPTLANGLLYILKSTESSPYKYYIAVFNRTTGELIYTEETKSYRANASQPVVYKHQLFCSNNSEFIRLANTDPPVTLEQRTQSEMGSMVATPNPVFDRVNLKYTISSGGLYSLQLFDISGRLINSLFDHRMHSEGSYSENIQIPAGLNSGIYLLRLQSEDVSHSARISIQR